jgi:hypothetical protein
MSVTLIASIVVNVVIAGLIIYYREGIKAVVEYQKSKKVEDYKKELEEFYERRRKSQLVAELFSRRFNKPTEIYEFEKLNWELALILPKDLVCMISEKLVKEDSKYAAMEVLIAIRERLGIKDGLEAKNIAYHKN